MPLVFNPGIPVGGGQTNLEFQWVGVKPTWNSSGWGSNQLGIPVGGGRNNPGIPVGGGQNNKIYMEIPGKGIK
jgi:hypothetical protein